MQDACFPSLESWDGGLKTNSVCVLLANVCGYKRMYNPCIYMYFSSCVCHQELVTVTSQTCLASGLPGVRLVDMVDTLITLLSGSGRCDVIVMS